MFAWILLGTQDHSPYSCGISTSTQDKRWRCLQGICRRPSCGTLRDSKAATVISDNSRCGLRNWTLDLESGFWIRSVRQEGQVGTGVNMDQRTPRWNSQLIAPAGKQEHLVRGAVRIALHIDEKHFLTKRDKNTLEQRDMSTGLLDWDSDLINNRRGSPDNDRVAP